MNPSEVVSGLFVFYQMSATYLAIYLSVLSAYLFVAYSVGSGLKPLHATFISTLFVLFSALLIISSLNVNLNGYAFEAAYSAAPNPYQVVGIFGVATIQLLSVIGALLFMRDIRKSDT